MKLLFVGVFDPLNRSTNNAQLRGFMKLDCQVMIYNFRERALHLGNEGRDQRLVGICQEKKPDLVVFSKCSEISLRTFEECSKISTTCLWWMDPLTTLEETAAYAQTYEKAKIVDYICTGVKNTIPIFEKYNQNIFYILEGYDHKFHKPCELEQDLDVTFIGSLHSARSQLISQINHPVEHFSNVFANEHAKVVSRSKINLNFSTAGGASDRVYKILGAGGFLLTSDWEGRSELFEDGEDLVIYKDFDDLNKKIDFFLKNPEVRKEIASQGFERVQEMTKDEWAKKVIDFYKEIKNEKN